MKIHPSLWVLLGSLLISYPAMPQTSSDLLPDTTQQTVQYAINEQRDNLRLLLEEQLTEIKTQQAVKAYNLAHLERITHENTFGAIPENTILALTHQVALDKIDEQILYLRSESTKNKLNSLTALKAGNGLEFVREGKESSFFQLKAFQAELEKATLIHHYFQERHKKIHRLALSGVTSWVQDHELELEVEKSRHAIDGWERKCTEQRKQYLMAEAELKIIHK